MANIYWDGGIVSNTPMDYVMEYDGAHAGHVHFSGRCVPGARPLPKTLGEVAEREKDIRFSSRTRFNSDHVKKMQDMSTAAARLAAKLPPELRDDPDAKLLQAWGCQAQCDPRPPYPA